MKAETIAVLAAMTKPYGDRILNGQPLEIELWNIDRSTFREPVRVTVIQTWMLDFYCNFYRCETVTGKRIDSTDLMDHNPIISQDDAGARFWK